MRYKKYGEKEETEPVIELELTFANGIIGINAKRGDRLEGLTPLARFWVDGTIIIYEDNCERLGLTPKIE